MGIKSEPVDSYLQDQEQDQPPADEGLNLKLIKPARADVIDNSKSPFRTFCSLIYVLMNDLNVS
jgi:hypothetical protein